MHLSGNTTFVIDHFHLTKTRNDPIDEEVHKDEWRTLANKQHDAIKVLPYLLYPQPATRTKTKTGALNRVHRSNRDIYRASMLKDAFAQFRDFTLQGSRTEFPALLEDLCAAKPHLIVAHVRPHAVDRPRHNHCLRRAQSDQRRSHELNNIIKKIAAHRTDGYRNPDALMSLSASRSVTSTSLRTVGAFFEHSDVVEHIPALYQASLRFRNPGYSLEYH